jgi:hypothetical protein
VIGSETQTHAPVASRARRRRGVPRGVLIALAAAAPTLVTVVLLYVHLGAHVRDFVPSFWNDQVGYWHRAASFSRVGLDSGYYAPNEHTAAWALNRFGVGGPWYPALYGAIGSLVGWELWTSIPINVVLLGLALAAFCLVGRLDRTQILLVALVGAARAVVDWRPRGGHVRARGVERVRHAVHPPARIRRRDAPDGRPVPPGQRHAPRRDPGAPARATTGMRDARAGTAAPAAGCGG